MQVMMDIMDSRVEWRSHRMHISHKKEYRRMEVGDRTKMERDMDGMYIWAGNGRQQKFGYGVMCKMQCYVLFNS
jgi:hypothetical protein